jgi:hypothetical protein
MLKQSYIKKINPSKYRVLSESGKNMGTYKTLSEAKKRLSQIEFFKQQDDLRQPMRTNLDLGERDLLKKIKKASDLLDGLGLKKEAQQLRDISYAATAGFILGSILAPFYIGASYYVSDLLEQNKQEVLSESIVPTIEVNPEEGETIRDITARNFPSLGDAEIDVVADSIGEQNYIAKDARLSKDDKVTIPSPGDLDLIAKKIKEKTELDRINKKTVTKKYVDTYKTPDDLSFSNLEIISDSEGFKQFAYDDENGKRWSKGTNVLGNLTIGYGHLLTEPELKSGKIIIDGKTYNWYSGLTKDLAKNLFEQDVIKNLPKLDFKNLKLDMDDLSVISSLSYLKGPRDIKELVELSLSDGRFDKNKFRKNLSNFSVGKGGGAPARRIAEILIIDNILLPPISKDEAKTMEDYRDFVNGKYTGKLTKATKTGVDMLTLSVGGFDSTGDKRNGGVKSNKMARLLDLIESKPVSSKDRLIQLISSI